MDYDKYEFMSSDDLKLIISQQQIEIERLSKMVTKLERKELDNSFTELISDEQKMKLHERFHKTYKTYPLKFISDVIYNDFKFYTITFSPQRFYNHTDEQYKEYILFHLLEIYLKYNAYMYGCFEYHKSGQIHAHLVIHHPSQQKAIQRYLNQQFNHSLKNKYCIDEGVKPITKQSDCDSIIEYINKECPYGMPKRWFEFGCKHWNNYHNNFL